jgi:hypothetical protein
MGYLELETWPEREVLKFVAVEGHKENVVTAS